MAVLVIEDSIFVMNYSSYLPSFIYDSPAIRSVNEDGMMRILYIVDNKMGDNSFIYEIRLTENEIWFSGCEENCRCS